MDFDFEWVSLIFFKKFRKVEKDLQLFISEFSQYH